MKPTVIYGRAIRRRMYPDGQNRRVYVYQTDAGELTTRELADAIGISQNALSVRASLYGINSPLMFANNKELKRGYDPNEDEEPGNEEWQQLCASSAATEASRIAKIDTIKVGSLEATL